MHKYLTVLTGFTVKSIPFDEIIVAVFKTTIT